MSGRRIGAGLLAVVAVATLGLTGCNQNNTPTEYNSLTQQNFLELCTNLYFDNTDGTLVQTTNTIKSGVTALDQTQCQCQYDVFVQQMPINKAAATAAGSSGPNFTDLNASLKNDPTAAWATVPASITSALTACASGSSGSGGASSTTTTVASTTTTN